MGKPNFFADTDVLNCLLGMQYDPKVSPVMDLTVDVPDLPIWFSLKSNAQEHTLTLYTQTELYMKNEGMASAMGHVIVNGQTGQVKMSVPQGIDQKNVAIFYMACRNLSIFAKEKGLATLWADDDPEQCGILLEQKNGSLTWRKVSGMDRPELLVQQLFGGTIKMRPYMEDFWDRSETDMMSLEEKIEKAEGGDKFAMAKLAQAYLDGDDEVEQDPVKAAYWFRKEAELKDSEGAFNLGLLYAKGFGVERDFEKAAEWMEKAVTWGDPDGKAPAALYRSMAENQKKAEAGDAAAMAALAEGYMGLGGSLDQAGSGKDYKLCLQWAQKAVDAGCAAGYWPLALAYEHGRGVPKNDKKAVELYRKGAEGGNAPCQHSYGCRLMTGESVGKDIKQAIALFEKSADQGYALANRSLGYMYEQGEVVEPDFDKELLYFERACQARPDDAELLRHVGYQYTNLMDYKDKWLYGVEKAASWLRKAADLGDRVAAAGADEYEQILTLHKEGKIPLGASMSDCMGYLSGNSGPKQTGTAPKQTAEAERRIRAEKQSKEKEAREKAERERITREAEERRRQTETARQEEQKRKEQQAAYDAAMAAWRQRKVETERKRADEVQRKLEQFKQLHKDRIEKEYIVFKSAAKARLDEAQKQQQKANEALSSLNFLQVSERVEAKNQLKEAQAQAAEASEAMAAADRAHRDAYAALPDLVAQEKDRLIRAAAAKYPIPKEPSKRTQVLGKESVRPRTSSQNPVRTPNLARRGSQSISEDILAWMEPDVTYTLQEIWEGVPSVVAAGLSKETVMSYMSNLSDRGEVASAVVNGVQYYTLA